MKRDPGTLRDEPRRETITVNGVDILIEYTHDNQTRSGTFKPITRTIDGVEYYLTPYAPEATREKVDIADVTDKNIRALAKQTGRMFYDEFKVNVIGALEKFAKAHPDQVPNTDWYKLRNEPFKSL